jgi:tetratricopeptide (TPR) repeat protein
MNEMKRHIILLVILFFVSVPFISEANSQDVLRLILPGKSWALQFDFKDFEIQDQGFMPDFKGRKIQARNASNHLIISAFLVPAKKQISATDYRDTSLDDMRKSSFNLTDIKTYEKDDKAFTEYIIKDVGEAKGLNQKNVFVYLIKDDIWIDLHLSKADFKDKDRSIFDEFISSVKLIDNYVPSSFDNFIFGSYFYENTNLDKAIEYYGKALEQEKADPKLSEDLWLILIDNLSMASGMSGNLMKSKEVLEYGISKKPEYPMFYYILGCAFAESGDIDKAIQNLRTAFKFKENMIKGEKMPDPSKDSSFKRYLNDPRFMEFLRTLN